MSNVPIVTHQQFADDTILFGVVKFCETRKLKEILEF